MVRDVFMFELNGTFNTALWNEGDRRVILYSNESRRVNEFLVNHIPTRREVQAEIIRLGWTDEITEVWQRVVDVPQEALNVVLDHDDNPLDI